MRTKIAVVLIILCFLGLTMASGCTSKEPEIQIENQVYMIEDESDIPPEYSALLKNKVIVLESKYCTACKVIIPKLENIEKELNMEFEYLDLSEESARQRTIGLGIIPQYTPTVVINCKVLIGAYPEDVYRETIIQAFEKDE